MKHYLQRAAVQGSPSTLAAVTGEHVRGAAVRDTPAHAFRSHFQDLQIGDLLLTHRRTVTEAEAEAEADIVGFWRHLGQLFAHAF